MYLFKKPIHERISEFVEVQARLELTYPSLGTTRTGDHPSGYTVDHNRIHLGSGQATFDAAKRALCDWKHFRFGWIELHRPDVDPEPNQTVGVNKTRSLKRDSNASATDWQMIKSVPVGI